MRVLMLWTLASACYTPSIADCQFECGAEQSCPDGTSCSAGFCRTGASTGSCGSLATDSSMAIDGLDSGSGSASPCASVLSPCGEPVVALVGSGACAALCAPGSGELFKTALDECPVDNGMADRWHIAILFSAESRDAYGLTFSQKAGWVGLEFFGIAAATQDWTWLDAGSDAQSLSVPPWESVPSGTDSVAIFETGDGTGAFLGETATKSEPFFCEYKLGSGSD